MFLPWLRQKESLLVFMRIKSNKMSLLEGLNLVSLDTEVCKVCYFYIC